MRNKFVSLKVLALLVIFCLTGSLTRAAVNLDFLDDISGYQPIEIALLH